MMVSPSAIVMTQIAEDSTEDEIVPGASGCLVALVVIAMFACYGLGIVTGGYAQRYLDDRKSKSDQHEAFPDPDGPKEEAQAAAAETPLDEPIIKEHAGARLTLDLATARLSRTGGAGEVKLPGLLLMRLRFKNITNHPLELTSWMHSGVRTFLAQLMDDQNSNFTSIDDANIQVGTYLITLPSYQPTQRIAPGEEATTWVAFSISTRPTQALKLALTATNYGGEGLVYFNIPAGAVVEGPQLD